MKIGIEIDDEVYQFLESRSINVAKLVNVFVLRCSHLVEETACRKKVTKEMDYPKIARMIRQVAQDLDMEDKAIGYKSKTASEKLKEKRIGRPGDEEHL